MVVLCSHWISVLFAVPMGSSWNSHTVNFNHAGASTMPTSVMQKVINHLQLEQAIGGYAANEVVAQELEQVHINMAQLIHADALEIALVESATVAWTRLFYAFANYQDNVRSKPSQKVILVSQAEYAANLVAILRYAQTHDNWTVRMIPSCRNPDGSSTGITNASAVSTILNHNYRVGDKVWDPACIALICITHIPTNSGIVNPVEEIGRCITVFNDDKRGSTSPILYLVDTCQSIGQRDVNVQDMHCHGLVATGRKYLRGPRGTGFLYSASNVSHIWPDHIDHFGVPVTEVPRGHDLDLSTKLEDIVAFSPRAGARRFEFWESNIANKLGLGEAVSLVLQRKIPTIAAEIKERASQLSKRLQSIKGVHLYYPSQCGIVTFWVDGIASEEVKNALDHDEADMRFAVSVVPATSTPLDSAESGVANLIRASVSYTTSETDIDTFCDRLESISR